MYRDNTAYDFELFAPKKKEVVEIPVEKNRRQGVHNKNKAVASANTGSVQKIFVTVGMVLSVLLLMVAQLSCQLQNSEVVDQIHCTEQSIETLQSENIRLQTELNGKISFTSMETAAKNMGMQKTSLSQTRYINLCNEDSAEVVENNSGLLAAINDLF
jgi:cell division protein FtsL